MATTYSTYEAKSRFSEIMRKVRGGETVQVSYHGRPVAKISPMEASCTEEETLERLRARGILSGPARSRPSSLRPVATIPGALQDFLDSRD